MISSNKKTWQFAALVIAIAIVVTLVTILIDYQSADAQIRSVILENLSIEDQAILDKFDDAEIEQNGSFIKFTGKQTLDPSLLQTIDNLSVTEEEQLEDANVSYEFTYDSETNIVTISAEMVNSLGEIEIDEIHGVAFYNDEGKIDAVMNVEGEPLLLSEMRDAGMIQNCGWFSKLIKKAAKVVTAAAVVVAAAAVVVATAGVAAPAVVGAGVAAATIVSGTALAIAGYATITAAIAAGVTLTLEVWDHYYPGSDIVIKDGVSYAKTYEDAKDIIIDITQANKRSNKKNPAIYFKCDTSANKPINIRVDQPMSFSAMATLMGSSGQSSITMAQQDAYDVIRAAMPMIYPIFLDKPSSGFWHWHACDVLNSNYDANRGYENNPRYRIGGREPHSFWCTV